MIFILWTAPPTRRPSLRARPAPAGADPQSIAADLIRKHPKRVVLCAQLSPGDPRLLAVEALTRALGIRTFDDSEISLDACLRDVHAVGIGDQ